MNLKESKLCVQLKSEKKNQAQNQFYIWILRTNWQSRDEAFLSKIKSKLQDVKFGAKSQQRLGFVGAGACSGDLT